MTTLSKALVVGVASYTSARPLRNSVNDAVDVANELKKFGFEVTLSKNPDAATLFDEINAFKADLNQAQVALFFFAGHGLQISSENFLAASDSNLRTEGSAKFTCVPLSAVLSAMEDSSAETRIVILDACRENPFANAYGRSVAQRGLAPVYVSRGTIIAFATSPGQIASDNPHGRNGSYTTALLQHIGSPDIPIETMFKFVRNTLSATTNGEQISWEHTCLSGNFYFNPGVGSRANIYTTDALQDSRLVIENSRSSHKLIKALKSLDWYKQNPALEDFSVDKASTYSKTNLFIIGRNIYQAACGSANAAKNYIESFMEKTQGLKAERRKALLDGMLFEVFFDSRAEFRAAPKVEMFPELFALQERRELADSFDFISGCLLPNSSRFYSLPGRSVQVGVDVIVSDFGDEFQLEEVHFAGRNILAAEDEGYVNSRGLPARFRTMEKESYVRRLSQELLVPQHLLKVTFNMAISDSDELRIPRGYTVAKY